jgi:hypothetical protein
VAMSALGFIYEQRKAAWREVNGIASEELRWEELNDEAAYYLRNIIVGPDA